MYIFNILFYFILFLYIYKLNNFKIYKFLIIIFDFLLLLFMNFKFIFLSFSLYFLFRSFPPQIFRNQIIYFSWFKWTVIIRNFFRKIRKETTGGDFPGSDGHVEPSTNNAFTQKLERNRQILERHWWWNLAHKYFLEENIY